MNFFKRIIASKVSQLRDWQANGEDDMPGPEIVIPNVDGDLYKKLLDEANAAGVAFNGTQASFEKVVLDWNFDLEAKTLHILPLKKPLIVSWGFVEAKIRALIQAAKTAI